MRSIAVRLALGSVLVGCILSSVRQVVAEEVKLTDPTGAVEVRVVLGDGATIAVAHKGRAILAPSAISMTLADGPTLGKAPRLVRSDQRAVDQVLRPEVRVKSAEVVDRCNELTLTLEGGYGLVVRAYPDAAAYRWTLSRQGPARVMAEQVDLRFAEDHSLYFPEEESFLTHSERAYKVVRLSEIAPRQFCSMPALVDVKGGPKVAITEADLLDYPGMYLAGTQAPGLSALFPAVALKEQKVNDRTVRVTERADYIAQTAGPRAFPWRVLVIAERDGDLIENQTVYKLASPCKLEDSSWIRPGKVAWDWWNANNIYGVDFRAGVNTLTYKYYIDFAARYGIEYIILDEGWYPLGNLLVNAPDMDVDELFRYGKEKGVGIVLWVTWKTLEDQLEPALERFTKWGAAGIKVDFMQRDDQWMVNYYEKVAREAAKRHMLVDFHGAYKPTGLIRTYPNVITSEGVKGLENSKWSKDVTPEHDVTLPFIRMLAGPMDYTPGAMLNAQDKDFAASFNRPMSQGTRCHQLAMYVVYESPLQMLADNPSNYLREPECMEFLAGVPAVWDQTKALDAKVGDYVLVARRHGKDWYVGAMTDWTARTLTADLSFLGAGSYEAQIYQDGVNADRYAGDYKKTTRTVTAKDKIEVKLAPGGGWAARLRLSSGVDR
ncbi:MAG: glycoside hydrolase family 97 protein [Phycisphaerae bacterium]|nr:glycoside hydrolase family 97 protein [Phycisphaerae bacterium]